MPDLSGPLFSLSASGTIAKAITYSNWRGIKYARQRVIPTNPKSTDQVKVRNIFSALSELWKTAPAAFYASYDAASKGKPYTNRNLLVRLNSANLYAATTWNPFAFSAEIGGAPNDITLTTTPGAGTMLCEATDPTPPTGWTVASVEFWALNNDVAPGNSPTPVILYGTDAASPYTHTFTGLTSGDPYVFGASVTYTHSLPVVTAYSPSVNVMDTPG